MRHLLGVLPTMDCQFAEPEGGVGTGEEQHTSEL